MRLPFLAALAALTLAAPAGAQQPPGAFPAAPLAPVATPAEQLPEPPTGMLLVVLGALGLVGGVADLATAPLCYASRVPSSQRPACMGTTIAVGVALVGAGIPLAVIGAGQRSRWLDWTKGVRAAVLPAGASLTWGTSW